MLFRFARSFWLYLLGMVRTKGFGNFFHALIIFLLLASVAMAIILGVKANSDSSRLKPEDGLLIFASALPNDTVGGDSWNISGRVIREGIYISDAIVYAVATDESGNQFLSNSTKTYTEGEFDVSLDIPGSNGVEISPIAAIAVVASEVTDDNETNAAVRKLDMQSGSISRLNLLKQRPLLPLESFINIPVIFIVSILLAFIQVRGNLPLMRLRYYVIAMLAILFAMAMIAYVGLTLQQISSASQGEPIPLGFATIFRGTYVDGVQQEWLLSFTAPDQIQGLSRGFGVPLWVLLFAVLGTSVFTVIMILRNLENPLNFSDMDDEDNLTLMRKRVYTTVQHQFYILFSPIASIIVYQMLVYADAASNPLTVALTIFSAGMSLPYILNRSSARLGALFDSENKVAAK